MQTHHIVLQLTDSTCLARRDENNNATCLKLLQVNIGWKIVPCKPTILFYNKPILPSHLVETKNIMMWLELLNFVKSDTFILVY